MSGRLQDKVIIITGGGTGIGWGITGSCAREGAAAGFGAATPRSSAIANDKSSAIARTRVTARWASAATSLGANRLKR